MLWFVRQREELPVPSVVGKSIDEATKILMEAGLDPRQGDVITDPTYPVGTVISQNPIGEKIVRKGRRVYLTLSGGERHVSVPNLRGRTLRDAKFQIEQQGLKIGRVTYQGSDEYPENTIVSQSLAPKVSVKRGTHLSVVVSQGRVSEKIETPDLKGKSLKEVEALLEDMGLKLGKITYQSVPDVLPNTVMDQFPRAGDMMQFGGSIDVFVSQQGGAENNNEEN